MQGPSLRLDETAKGLHPLMFKEKAAGFVARRLLRFQDPLGLQAWIMLAAVIGGVLILKPAPESGAWFWALSLLIVGLPHGAFDLEAIRQLAGSSCPRVSYFVILARYVLIMALCLVFLVMAPMLGLLSFLALSCHHLGHSDSVWTRHQARPKFSARIPAWGHGLIVITAPFYFSPQAAWAPFERIVVFFGGQASLSTEAFRMAALWCLVAAVVALVVGLTELIKKRRSEEFLQQLVVLGLSFLLAAVAPPLLSVGVYFVAVHAMGHCSTASVPPRSNALPVSYANVLRVHLRSLPLLVPSLIIVGLVSLQLDSATSLPERLATASIFFYAIVTLPHHLLWSGNKFLSTIISRPSA